VKVKEKERLIDSESFFFLVFGEGGGWIYLEQEPSALQVFLEKIPPFPHLVPTFFGCPGIHTGVILPNVFRHFGLFVHLLVARPQTDPGRRLVQKAVQHLVLGTAAPASHSSDLSTAPFPHTAAAAPTDAAGGMIGVFESDCGGRVFEGVLD